MIDTDAIFANHDQTIKTDAGEFLVVQRNVGYAHNDGAWIVSQLPDLYWAPGGYLTKRRDGRTVGIFADVKDAEQAIRDAQTMPELDRHVVLSGR